MTKGFLYCLPVVNPGGFGFNSSLRGFKIFESSNSNVCFTMACTLKNKFSCDNIFLFSPLRITSYMKEIPKKPPPQQTTTKTQKNNKAYPVI